MSRLFDDAQSESLNVSGAPATAVPLAIVALANFDDLDAVHSVVCIGDASLNQNIFMIDMVGTNATDPVRAVASTAQVSGIAALPSAVSLNTWHHIAGLYLTNASRYVYVDGVASNENTTDVTPSGLDEVAIGELLWTSRINFMSGNIAEVAVWDLTDWGADAAERKTAFEAALAGLEAGEPATTYPTGLVAYWSLETASLDDEIGELDLTATGTSFSYDHPSVYRYIGGSVSAQSALTGNLISPLLYNLAGLIAGQSSFAGNINVTEKLSGLIDAQSSLSGEINTIEKLAGLTGANSSVTGILNAIESISGGLSATSGLTGNLVPLSILTLAGLIEAQSGVAATNLQLVKDLNGLIAAQSALTGKIDTTESLAGLIAAQSVLTAAELVGVLPLAGSIDATTSLTGLLKAIETLAGIVAVQSGLTGSLVQRYAEIPPFMQKDLIDPYASGAWLWLVQIAVPGQATQRIARNTKDVRYDGGDYEKFNLQIGEQIFSGDGSIPRVTLKIFQDVNRKVEDIVNATEGALGAAVKLIRVNEKWLYSPVAALEADYDNLASQSDNEWVTFTLGIPNPLTQRFPLNMFSSSMCPEAHPDLFKGPACQYPGADPTCTGSYEDCYSKDNAAHWGGELGLDPSVTRGNR